MDKKWMRITAAVIEIIHGAGGVVLGVLFILLNHTLGEIFGGFSWYGDLLGLAIIIVGVLALAGGVYAIKKKKWALALTGAIGAFLLTLWSLEYWINIDTYGFSLNTLYGIAGAPAVFTIILVIFSRKQFKV